MSPAEENAELKIKVEWIKALISQCPFGYGDGMVRTHRNTATEDIIAWLKELFRVRDEF